MGQINYRKINQDIYEMDNNISRNNEMVFIATLVIAICSDADNKKTGRLISKIKFMQNDDGTEPKPVDQLIEIAKRYVSSLGLAVSTKEAVFSSFDSIKGASTGLNNKKIELKKFIEDFIDNVFPYIEPQDLFFEGLYMGIDKKANTADRGIILTPVFIADLMTDLLDLDYKTDVVADLCAGTGLFSIYSYTKMLRELENDRRIGNISIDEYSEYLKRLSNSIIANDIDTKMVTVCLANFLLKNIDTRLLFNMDCLTLKKSSFKIDEDNHAQPTKAILNPPYEDASKPLEIILQNIELVKKDDVYGHKVVAIVPSQKFGQNRAIFSKILNLSTLTCVIKTQDDLFKDSGKAQPASIFVFDTTRGHRKDDIIRYYNFTDTGYIYLKDSGLVDKKNTFGEKKQKLLNRINNVPSVDDMNETMKKNDRSWNNFYEVSIDYETFAKIDPILVKNDTEESDISLENIAIKKALREKNDLLNCCDNSFVDNDGTFEDYIVGILSGVN